MEPIIKSMQVYIFDGPAPNSLSGIEPNIVYNYHEDGREESRVEDGVPTYCIYDADKRLVEERTVNEEVCRSKVYEYDPEGELIHIHTENLALGYGKGYEMTINGAFDTNRVIERVEMVPMGKTIDEWFSWEEEGQVRRTEVSVKNEEGDVLKYSVLEKIIDGEVVGRRYINSKGKVELECHGGKEDGEFVYDEHGNWTHWKIVNEDGLVNTEVVRIIDY